MSWKSGRLIYYLARLTVDFKRFPSADNEKQKLCRGQYCCVQKTYRDATFVIFSFERETRMAVVKVLLSEMAVMVNFANAKI